MVVNPRLISYSENNYSYCAAGAGWSLAEIGNDISLTVNLNQVMLA
jgi:hypothetical protein